MHGRVAARAGRGSERPRRYKHGEGARRRTAAPTAPDTTRTMGRQALIAALCCLLVSAACANSVLLKEQLRTESARLYRHAPGLVYAAAAPYGAYSFHVPAVAAPQPAGSRIEPIKDSHSIQHANGNGYLKDSYGNRFVEALQSMKALPFRPFPQQYVQLQELPVHLAQPLAASFQQQHKAAPQPFGAAYRLPAAASAPHNQHYTYATAHAGYADALKNLPPAAVHYGPNFGSVFHLPVQSVAPTREPHRAVQFSHDSTHSLSENQEHRSVPHQTGHRSVFIEQPQEHYQKYQQSQESASEEVTVAPTRYVKPKPSTQELVSAVKEIPVQTVVNGKKTVVNVETKPPLPLLDINLLEPLTFANPLVPQVQHFLPRINEAKYHKLPELQKHEDKKYQKEIRVQKTKSYDSGVIKGKPKKPKKKQKSGARAHSYDDEYNPAATAHPPLSVTKALDNAPEIVYEINAPNHKETIKEKSVTYNKVTNSEPVHYTYGTNTRKEPVQYTYSHSSKEPLQIKEVRYEGKGEGPKHLIYNSKPGELSDDSNKPKSEAEDSGESGEHSNDEPPERQNQKKQHFSHDAPKTRQHYVPEHREHEYQHRASAHTHHGEHEHSHSAPGGDSPRAHHHYHYEPSSGGGHQHAQHGDQHHHHHHKPSSGHQNTQHKDEGYHHRPHSDTHHSVQHSGKHGQYPALEVTPHQYEEDISFSAPVTVDPDQHVQREREPAQHAGAEHASHHHSDTKPRYNGPTMQVHEKTKQVYIKEETPEHDESIGEQIMKKLYGQEEDKEQDFENAYKNAAYGFPAYDKPAADVEKEIYNPENYGTPRDYGAYNIDHAPFQQYQGPGDDFPKQMRLSYQDARDKTKEDYFLDYSVSKPTSLLDRHNNKVGYYKLYKDQKPEKYVAHEADKKQKSAKLTAIPYSYYPAAAAQGDGMKQFLEQYKGVAAPYVFEYDYSKGFSAVPAKPAAGVDSSAHASRPLQRYKMTHFVEPQFQYGFEPVGLPRLLDSELAAMATNHSPDEKPATRKKIYKENFYIKKTSMSDANPNS